MLSSTKTSVKSIKMNTFNVNIRRGALWFSQGGRKGYPACIMPVRRGNTPHRISHAWNSTISQPQVKISVIDLELNERHQINLGISPWVIFLNIHDFNIISPIMTNLIKMTVPLITKHYFIENPDNNILQHCHRVHYIQRIGPSIVVRFTIN